MKKLIFLLILSGLLLLVACPRPSSSSGFPTPELPPDLYGRVGIEPGEVEVENLYAGAKDVVYPVTLYNGKDEAAQFSINYKKPGKLVEGYLPAPEEARDWVIIADPAPVLKAREVRNVLIELRMPEGAQAPDKWQFLIVVKDVTQTGMVQTEYECRWLVTMR